MTSIVDPQKKLEYDRAWRAKNIQKVRNSALKYHYAHPDKNKKRARKVHLRVQYGITEEQYQELWTKQNGLCAICQCEETAIGRHGKPRKLAVDHCHRTKKVRGLLCFRCNTCVGLINDNITLLNSAIKYLGEYN